MKPKRKKSRKDAPTACKNSFHYLVKHADLSKQRLTKCSCSRVKKEIPIANYSDITSFFIKPKKISQQKRRYSDQKNLSHNDNVRHNIDQRKVSPNDRLDMKHIPKVLVSRTTRIISQSDQIREEHDRGKKKMDAAEITWFLL